MRNKLIKLAQDSGLLDKLADANMSQPAAPGAFSNMFAGNMTPGVQEQQRRIGYLAPEGMGARYKNMATQNLNNTIPGGLKGPGAMSFNQTPPPAPAPAAAAAPAPSFQSRYPIAAAGYDALKTVKNSGVPGTGNIFGS